MDPKIIWLLSLLNFAACIPDPGVNIDIHVNVNDNEGPEPEPETGSSNGNGERPAVMSDDEFMSTFNKNYKNEEEKTERMRIYHETCKKIREHNKLYDSGKSGFMMGCNQFSDMTEDEVMSQFTGILDDFNSTTRMIISRYTPVDLGQEPESLNYEKLGALNPIRSQNPCGSCWAFSTVASIESHIALEYSKRVHLSEQYLVDCSPGDCKGWHVFWALDYVIHNGIALRDTYPYTGRDDTCNVGAPKTSYKVTGIQQVQEYKEDELINALHNVGPINIYFNVTDKFFWHKEGVYTDQLCISKAISDPTDHTINHAMLLVGYGTEPATPPTATKPGYPRTPYWLVRNSWGKSWGENGYVKINRTEPNHCQISKYAWIPIIEGATIQVECITCEGSTGQQYFLHPADCTKFMQCTNSGPVEKSCPAGTRWNQEIKGCGLSAVTPCSVGVYTYPGGSCEAPAA